MSLRMKSGINHNGNGLSNIKDTSSYKQMAVLHQSMHTFRACLSYLIDTTTKYKQNVPHISASRQNVEIASNSKLKFTERKDLLIKRVQKNWWKMNYM